MKQTTEYSARVNGKHIKKFTRRAAFMNSTWETFNRYAKQKGYTTPVEDGKYLGALAWANEAGEIMELTRV